MGDHTWALTRLTLPLESLQVFSSPAHTPVLFKAQCLAHSIHLIPMTWQIKYMTFWSHITWIFPMVFPLCKYHSILLVTGQHWIRFDTEQSHIITWANGDQDIWCYMESSSYNESCTLHILKLVFTIYFWTTSTTHKNVKENPQNIIKNSCQSKHRNLKFLFYYNFFFCYCCAVCNIRSH